MIDAFDLEKKIVSKKRHQEAPKKALALYESETAIGVPTAIAYDKKHGWFVIQTSGQGPYIIWSEQEGQ